MRYCERNNCDNNLITVIKNDELIFRCLVCYEEYPSTDDDTLIIDEPLQEKDSIYKYRDYLKNAHGDTIAELAKMPCKNTKCNETNIIVIKLYKNGQQQYVCPTCKLHFV